MVIRYFFAFFLNVLFSTFFPSPETQDYIVIMPSYFDNQMQLHTHIEAVVDFREENGAAIYDCYVSNPIGTPSTFIFLTFRFLRLLSSVSRPSFTFVYFHIFLFFFLRQMLLLSKRRLRPPGILVSSFSLTSFMSQIREMATLKFNFPFLFYSLHLYSSDLFS